MEHNLSIARASFKTSSWFTFPAKTRKSFRAKHWYLIPTPKWSHLSSGRIANLNVNPSLFSAGRYTVNLPIAACS